MINYRDHLILSGSIIKDALLQLTRLGIDVILFVVDENERLIGSITDGDIRRGLIKGISIEQPVSAIIQPHPRFIIKGIIDIQEIIAYREQSFRIIPVVKDNGVVIDIINFRQNLSYLPIDVVIMAGGLGQRLQPLTASTPKPMLHVGTKPIIEHNIDRLILFGIYDIWVSVRYLAEQIENYFGDGQKKGVNIKYVHENEPLGTIGGISIIRDIQHDYILVTNSDILTNIDYEQFFLYFLKHDADLAIVSIPFQVKIPYAVLETEENNVTNFEEKPTYTYQCNGGIYLMKKSVLNYLQFNTFFNSTDLIELLIKNDRKVISYPFSGYWMDIGNHNDFEKAQVDIKSINLK